MKKFNKEQKPIADLSPGSVANAMLCAVLIAWKDQFGFHGGYCKCDKPAKYNVSYLCPVRKRVIETLMCGTHLNATKKNAERLKKQCQYDSKLKVECL